MTLTTPYPSELLRLARKVVWYDKPEQTLADLANIPDALDGLRLVS
jgi:hypothetical protein